MFSNPTALLTWLDWRFFSQLCTQTSQLKPHVSSHQLNMKIKPEWFFFLNFPWKCMRALLAIWITTAATQTANIILILFRFPHVFFLVVPLPQKTDYMTWLATLFLLDHIFIRKFVNWVCAAVCTRVCDFILHNRHIICMYNFGLYFKNLFLIIMISNSDHLQLPPSRW